MVDYANMAAKEHALLNRIEIAMSEEERLLLEELSIRNHYVATLLPIRIVGVQGDGDCRTYIPGTYLPEEVVDQMVEAVLTVPGT
ncbi:hypothetical protein OUZ56_027275 [Daphnia magna]|uniref:Uncharacterized protein n=1 Tax=Daphnia magna TaxID=35525 RepID=A0ABQ9ZPA4_9CRUS|nr:hypothetical protein OUZ56_027275 [Daphnia magna]